MIRKKLQSVITACTITAVDVDMAKTKVWPGKIRIRDTLIHAGQNEVGGLIDVAISTLMNLMTADVIELEHGVAGCLVLNSGAILIRQRIVVGWVERLKQRRRLRGCRIEG